MSGRAGVLIAVLAAAAGVMASIPARAQEAPGTYGFEADTQGFAAIAFKDGAIEPDSGSTVSVAREKENVHSGTGALAYSYKVEPGGPRLLAAECVPPKGTQSVRFWAKCSKPAILAFGVREALGGDFSFSAFVPAGQWVEVSGNLDEFQAGDGARKGSKPEAGSITSASFMDFANMLVNAGGEVSRLVADLQGPRTLWIDDLQFSPQRLPQTTGVVAGPPRSLLVDSFETPTVRWIAGKVSFGDGQPKFELLPAGVSLQVRADAAPPGAPKTPLDPGGKGLRFAYNRAPGEAYVIVRPLEKEDLSGIERLRLSLNASRKSLLILNLKERDDSEYQYLLMPEQTVGWQNLDLALSEFRLSENSKDENNMLDVDQIKELSIIDGSAFIQLEGGDVTVDVDGVSFQLK